MAAFSENLPRYSDPQQNNDKDLIVFDQVLSSFDELYYQVQQKREKIESSYESLVE